MRRIRIRKPPMGIWETSADFESWNNLPPEVLEIILNKLKNRKNLLACRGVNSIWKATADRILTKRSISKWISWNAFSDPTHCSRTNYLPQMKLRLMSRRGRGGKYLQMNHPSLPIMENLKLMSPFPTASLKMDFTIHKEITMEMNRDPFQNFGHFLTIFHLTNFYLPFEDFNAILRPMQNLKVFSLSVVFPPNNRREIAPPLPNLSHLRILQCDEGLIQILCNSYNTQLIGIETDMFLPLCSRPFTNLRTLKLVGETGISTIQNSLSEHSHFPALKGLAIFSDGKTFGWEELIGMVETLPKKLINLHLHVETKSENPYDFFYKNLKLISTFPDVHTLGIIFPHSEIQAEWLGRWFLAKFPNVEVLNLLNYQQYLFVDLTILAAGCEQVLRTLSLDKKTIVKRVVAAGAFWNTCPELKKIKVYRNQFYCEVVESVLELNK